MRLGSLKYAVHIPTPEIPAVADEISQSHMPSRLKY